MSPQAQNLCVYRQTKTRVATYKYEISTMNSKLSNCLQCIQKQYQPTFYLPIYSILKSYAPTKLIVLIFNNLKSMQGLGDILHQQQIKQLIKRITEIDIRDYANAVWFKQDENLQKLNMQLHVNALMKNDQYILQESITEDKFKILIYDLIMTTTWKQRVLPLITDQTTHMNSLKLYLAIYHESVICNILEVLMFHRTAIDQSGQFLIEVIGYCYKKISRQIAERMRLRKVAREEGKVKEQQKKEKLTEQEKKQIKISKIMNRNPQEEVNKQIEDIEFSLFIMSISILRYVTDYIKFLQIGILHHLLVQCNIFSLLVPLIEERPWLRTNEKGQRQVFQNSKWTIIPKSQYGKLPKTEAQVWIAIYNLLMDPDCRKKYELNDERKNNLLKLRKFLNEVLLDQIPQLSHLLRSLEQLSLMTVPTHLVTNPFVVEQMPILVSRISNNRNWQEIAEEHAGRLKQSMDETQKQQIQRLADLYTNNTVEGLIDGFKCKKCQKQAFKRCSKCKSVWYCCKECQVGDWSDHKTACNKIAKEIKENEGQKKQKQVKVPEIAAAKPSIDELD